MVFPKPDSEPKNELLLPVLAFPASLPKKELFDPVLVVSPAAYPKNELPPPTPLAAPALIPAKTLEEKSETVKARTPPIFNCVAALKTFAVPVPLMLKLLLACGDVVFCT